jgi:HlyD family secretion protein
MTGAGKVQVGQEVYVKLNNYPFMEFGVLKGVIKEISQIPFDNQYNVEVNFPDGFVSTYGISLELSPLMHGIAEVIIERKSLYNRIADQMKSMRYNR